MKFERGGGSTLYVVDFCNFLFNYCFFIRFKEKKEENNWARVRSMCLPWLNAWPMKRLNVNASTTRSRAQKEEIRLGWREKKPWTRDKPRTLLSVCAQLCNPGPYSLTGLDKTPDALAQTPPQISKKNIYNSTLGFRRRRFASAFNIPAPEIPVLGAGRWALVDRQLGAH